MICVFLLDLHSRRKKYYRKGNLGGDTVEENFSYKSFRFIVFSMKCRFELLGVLGGYYEIII